MDEKSDIMTSVCEKYHQIAKLYAALNRKLTDTK